MKKLNIIIIFGLILVLILIVFGSRKLLTDKKRLSMSKCTREELTELKVKILATKDLSGSYYTLTDEELQHPCFPEDLREKYEVAKHSYLGNLENDMQKPFFQALKEFFRISVPSVAPSPVASTLTSSPSPQSCFKYDRETLHPNDVLAKKQKPRIELIITTAEISDGKIRIIGRVDGYCLDDILPEIGFYEMPNDRSKGKILLTSSKPNNGQYELITEAKEGVFLIEGMNTEIGVISDYFSVGIENGIMKIIPRRV